MAGLRLGIQISGRGSNLQALIDACAKPGFPAGIAVVLSNNPRAAGLERARRAGITTAVVNHRDFADRAAFDAALDEVHRKHGVDLICNAGFMRILTGDFVDSWRDRIINIHPSLLPAFPGLHTHERVLEAGARFSGCTVHFTRAELDAGPIIVQAVVPVMAGDTPETLAARVLEAEHICYPRAVRLIAEGRVRIEGTRVLIDGARAPECRLINPAKSAF